MKNNLLRAVKKAFGIAFLIIAACGICQFFPKPLESYSLYDWDDPIMIPPLLASIIAAAAIGLSFLLKNLKWSKIIFSVTSTALAVSNVFCIFGFGIYSDRGSQIFYEALCVVAYAAVCAIGVSRKCWKYGSAVLAAAAVLIALLTPSYMIDSSFFPIIVLLAYSLVMYYTQNSRGTLIIRADAANVKALLSSIEDEYANGNITEQEYQDRRAEIISQI